LATNGATLHKPLGLLAELTHRCPLGCPYCSNPLALEGREDELDTQTWARVFREAAALGVLQVHLSGGEPGARRDLVEITAAANKAGLYTNLITSAVGVTAERFAALKQLLLDRLSDGPRRKRALQQVAMLDPAAPLPGEERLAEVWTRWAQSPPAPNDREKSLVEVSQKIGCAADGAPYVIHRWIEAKDELLFADNPPARTLTAAFLDEAQCLGARGLSNEDKAALKGLRDPGSR